MNPSLRRKKKRKSSPISAYSFVSIISLPDLGQEKPALERLVDLAKQFNRRAGMALLARLNLYLSLAHLAVDPRVKIQVQEKLTRQVSSPARLTEMTKAFRKRGLYDKYVLLHRAQLLVGIKLIALYGRDQGGNCLETLAAADRIPPI